MSNLVIQVIMIVMTIDLMRRHTETKLSQNNKHTSC